MKINIIKEMDVLIGMIQRNTNLQASNYSIYKDKVTGYRNRLFKQAMIIKRHLSKTLPIADIKTINSIKFPRRE